MEKAFGDPWTEVSEAEANLRTGGLRLVVFFVGQEFPDPKNHGTGDPRPLRKTHIRTSGYIF